MILAIFSCLFICFRWHLMNFVWQKWIKKLFDVPTRVKFSRNTKIIFMRYADILVFLLSCCRGGDISLNKKWCANILLNFTRLMWFKLNRWKKRRRNCAAHNFSLNISSKRIAFFLFALQNVPYAIAVKPRNIENIIFLREKVKLRDSKVYCAL